MAIEAVTGERVDEGHLRRESATVNGGVGGYMSEAQARAAGRDFAGATPDNVAALLREHGVRTVPHPNIGSLDALRDATSNGRPGLLLLTDADGRSRGTGHFVVVDGVDADGTVHIRDPQPGRDGGRRTESWANLHDGLGATALIETNGGEAPPPAAAPAGHGRRR